MEQTKNILNDPIQTLTEYHNEMSEYVLSLVAVFKIKNEKNATAKIDSIRNFFSKTVLEHFEFEERDVFPFLKDGISTPAAIKLALELRDEHAVILREFKFFLEQLNHDGITPDGTLSGSLFNSIEKIADLLLAHTAKEDDQLLPLLKKNIKLFKDR